MNEAAAATLIEQNDSKRGRVQVWDPFVRIFHWTLASSFFITYLAEDDWLTLHVWAGYLILALLFIRVAWGFIGPKHARWGDFIKEPSEISQYLKDSFRGRAKHYLGHNPAGGAMVVALIISLLVTGISGLTVYGTQELSGPLAPWLGGLPRARSHVFEDVHEVMANFTLLLVVFHVLGVFVASFQHRENLIKSMITGKKRQQK